MWHLLSNKLCNTGFTLVCYSCQACLAPHLQMCWISAAGIKGIYKRWFVGCLYFMWLNLNEYLMDRDALTQTSLLFFLSLPFNLPAYANTTNPPHLPAEASPTSVPTGGSWEAADCSTNTSAILFCTNLIHEVPRTKGFYEALKKLNQVSDVCGVTEVAELPPAHPRYTHLY